MTERDIVLRMSWWGCKRRAPRNMPTILKDCAEAAETIARLRNALAVAEQAANEFQHALNSGPGWYTKGEGGMYSHVRSWLDRLRGAINTVKDANHEG